jgi:hypothetical protein
MPAPRTVAKDLRRQANDPKAQETGDRPRMLRHVPILEPIVAGYCAAQPGGSKRPPVEGSMRASGR